MPKKAATEPSLLPMVSAPTKGRLKAALRKPAAPAPVEAPADGSGVRLVPLSALAASDLNPRKSFDHDDLMELAASIAAQGLLQNLVVRADPVAPGVFRVVAGERRFRALRLLADDGRWDAAAAAVPVRVVEADDGQHLALAILENLQRKDINPMEEAEGFARLHALDADRWSTAAIAAAIGATQRHVQQRLALVGRLDDAAKAALREGAITVSEARALTAAAPETQRDVVAKIRDGAIERGAAAVREELADHTFLARNALFGRLEYNGPITQDPDSGEPVFTDMEQVRTLQAEAVARRAAELGAEGCAVLVLHQCRSAPAPDGWQLRSEGLVPWPQGTALPAGARRAAVLAVMRADLSVVELRDLAKMPKQTAAAATRAAAVSAGERIWCRNARTRALQAALFAGPGRRTLLAHLCLALMGGEHTLLAVRTEHVDPDTRVLAPAVAGFLDLFRDEVAAAAAAAGLPGSPITPATDSEPWPLVAHPRDRNGAWLLGYLQRRDDLGELADVLLIARAGTWGGDPATGDVGRFGPATLGDRTPALAAALQLGLTAAGGPEILGDDYLAKLDAGRLDALARAVGYPNDHRDDAWHRATAKQRRVWLGQWIAANPPATLPPLLCFGTSAAMAAALRDAAAPTD